MLPADISSARSATFDITLKKTFRSSSGIPVKSLSFRSSTISPAFFETTSPEGVKLIDHTFPVLSFLTYPQRMSSRTTMETLDLSSGMHSHRLFWDMHGCSLIASKNGM